MSEYFKEDARRYFKHFRVMFVIEAVILVAMVAAIVRFNANGGAWTPYESTNTERVYGDKRVFDYGDQLTDSEEAELEAYIHEAEKQICDDIVIVTLNQSLKDYEPEYKSRYSMNITPDKYVMVFGDKFWEDNKFGYDCPQVLDGSRYSGDGVILVDNVYREDETGKIYTWMCTTGECETTYSSDMIDYALDAFYDYVDSDYLYACKRFVDTVENDMKKAHGSYSYTSALWPFFVAALIMIIYFFANIKSKAGKVTTNSGTYLESGSFSLPVQQDIFIRKSVKKVYNPPQSSSGGGGGGHHTSGGGGSHGGGGHSR